MHGLCCRGYAAGAMLHGLCCRGYGKRQRGARGEKTEKRRDAPVDTDCHRSLGGRASSSVPGFPSLRRERERQNLCRAGSATNWSRSNYGEGRIVLRGGPESSGPLPGPRSPLPLPTIRAERTPAPLADTRTRPSATDTGTRSLVPYATRAPSPDAYAALRVYVCPSVSRARLSASRSFPLARPFVSSRIPVPH